MAEKKEVVKEIDIVAQLQKEFGEGAIMRLGDKVNGPMEVVSTGSLGLDAALGVWGLPKGRIVEIYGPESSGKTTLATHVIAEAQKAGDLCAIIDAEHAFDSAYAAKLGVDVDNLLISQPDFGEQALEIADRLISSGKVGVVVIDSVAALVPKGELEGEMGESKMGLHARLMSQALRKLTGTVHNNNCLLIFINQLRDKIGVMFGSPETTTGGNALKFYASVRIDVRRSLTAENSVKDGDEMLGNLVKLKVVKNKVGPPFKVAENIIIYNKGFDKISEIIELTHKAGIIKKWGKQITLFREGEEPIKFELDEFKAILEDNPDFYQELKNKLIKFVNDLRDKK
jgi:recombination protein RecA